MFGRTTRRPCAARALALAAALVAAIGGGSASLHADVLPTGSVRVGNEMRFEWGPLGGRIARPVAAIAGDTWETLATRETASVAWAPTIRALNGGGDAPAAGIATWVPPRTLAVEAKEPLVAVYLDSAKFGRANDVSRSGFRILDPMRDTHDVFGEVTLAIVAIRGPDDATVAASIPRRSASTTLRERPGGARIVDLGRVVETAPLGAPLRRVVQTWRCDAIAADGAPTFALAREERFDGQGGALVGDGAGGELAGYVPIVAAALAAALAAIFLYRRRTRSTAPPSGP